MEKDEDRKGKKVVKEPPSKKQKTQDERAVDRAIRASLIQETRRAESLRIGGPPRQNPPRSARPPPADPRPTQAEIRSKRRAEVLAQRQQEQQAQGQVQPEAEQGQQGQQG